MGYILLYIIKVKMDKYNYVKNLRSMKLIEILMRVSIILLLIFIYIKINKLYAVEVRKDVLESFLYVMKRSYLCNLMLDRNELIVHGYNIFKIGFREGLIPGGNYRGMDSIFYNFNSNKISLCYEIKTWDMERIKKCFIIIQDDQVKLVENKIYWILNKSEFKYSQSILVINAKDSKLILDELCKMLVIHGEEKMPNLKFFIDCIKNGDIIMEDFESKLAYQNLEDFKEKLKRTEEGMNNFMTQRELDIINSFEEVKNLDREMWSKYRLENKKFIINKEGKDVGMEIWKIYKKESEIAHNALERIILNEMNNNNVGDIKHFDLRKAIDNYDDEYTRLMKKHNNLSDIKGISKNIDDE